MKTALRITAVALVVGLLFGAVGWTDEPADAPEAAYRGRRRYVERDKPGPAPEAALRDRDRGRKPEAAMRERAAAKRREGLLWFLSLPSVKKEIEKHRKNLQEIQKETREDIRDILQDAHGDPDAGREAVLQEIEDRLADSAEDTVDEHIRHHEAVAYLLERHKDEAVEKLREEFNKRHKAQGERWRRRQKGDIGAPEGEGDPEGAIF